MSNNHMDNIKKRNLIISPPGGEPTDSEKKCSKCYSPLKETTFGKVCKNRMCDYEEFKFTIQGNTDVSNAVKLKDLAETETERLLQFMELEKRASRKELWNWLNQLIHTLRMREDKHGR